ncbi:tetratricopeptide repeat protein [Rosistilla oblonga]|uniref:tetratricopeptide repeat protein n=1 Tax=Rosistilla oblonga TaxID=2527990 RepID=UPI003A97845B
MSEQKLRFPILCIGLITMLSGCRVGTGVHVWQPPLAANAAGKRIAVAPPVGPRALAGELSQSIAREQPKLPQRAELVSQYELSQSDAIQLVSFDGRAPSDLALLPVAKQAGLDFLLVGEVLNDPFGDSRQPLAHDDPDFQFKLGQFLQSGDDDQILAFSWRVIDVENGQTVWANPMSVSKAFVDRTYPDLAGQQTSLSQQLQAAAGRETWKLFAPFVDQYQTELAVPWISLGAKQTREGNRYALEGEWQQAEACWRQVLAEHPRQLAALHNLAVAAVARQDYAEARRLATEALSKRDSRLFQESLVWVEARQREYHQAFGLPDPVGGWTYQASRPAAVSLGSDSRGKSQLSATD